MAFVERQCESVSPSYYLLSQRRCVVARACCVTRACPSRTRAYVCTTHPHTHTGEPYSFPCAACGFFLNVRPAGFRSHNNQVPRLCSARVCWLGRVVSSSSLQQRSEEEDSLGEASSTTSSSKAGWEPRARLMLTHNTTHACYVYVS